MKSKFSTSMSDAFGSIAYLAVIILTIFGIFRAFHKGIGNGVASVLLPPYAWYCAAAIIWEPPQWKEEWDENTRIMAVSLLASGEQTVENQIYIGQKTDELHKWATKIPQGTRFKLKADASLLCQQYDDYAKSMIDAILAKRPFQKYTNAISYPSEPSFERVLEEVISQQAEGDKAVYEAMLKSENKIDALKAGMDIYFKTIRGQQDFKMKAIFTQ